ncbi:DNA-directed RNA polymerase III subunit RPC8 [Plasmodium inui San Antonio 1]|uniref:DNA-directed RNA polymerase III subunit RPC8 n=1 Tax=Plasmodium inui San Antonio 1 TaxID=1237626 RepID=W6ZXL1_9APIC|nr:DNA-directed RNA polymerase III subunit RPC8 [Plasmodium inui San Antonio 1]EUD65512.1 DNA-directed RNA polymerase III subunit RPC8 [Plasmodium inui San Antonio 1]
MFSLFRIEDVIKIEPHFMEEELKNVIEFLIRAKYVDKVLQNVGLCVGLYDILEVKNREILKGTGEIRFDVIFRLVYFQPFENEIIEGFVKNSDSNGIIISIGFFENIRVNCANLREPKELYDESYESDESDKKEKCLLFDADKNERLGSGNSGNNLPVNDHTFFFFIFLIFLLIFSFSPSDIEKKEWFWTYEGIKFFYTKDELIRVRVLDTYFSDPNEMRKDQTTPSMSITVR